MEPTAILGFAGSQLILKPAILAAHPATFGSNWKMEDAGV